MTRSDADDRTVPAVPIPEIRDYQRINAELTRLLDEGHARVRLSGAEGHRLLVSDLAGSWQAVVEIEGRAGPEFAAGLDAPGLTVVCRGPAADGAARGLRAGRVVILGDAGDALGYAQQGGLVLVSGSAGARAGLNQHGGVLAVLGTVGRLAGDRQSGGRLFAFDDRIGPHAGRGAPAGRLVRLAPGDDPTAGVDPDDAVIYRTLLGGLAPWLDRVGECDGPHPLTSRLRHGHPDQKVAECDDLGSDLSIGIVVAACVIPVAGCREELGPERFRTTTVSGVVRNAGRPVLGGWIEFHPIDSTVGNLRAVPIGPDGSFHADRVPIGPNIIQLTAVRVGPGPDPYLDTSRLPIRRVISDRPAPPLVIDVLDERVRHFTSRTSGH